MNNWQQLLKHVTPGNVLKWASVLFVVAFQIIVIIALVLSMAGVFD